MIFVDEARIFVKGGNGGNGCESFYKDKYHRFPRPDGGDGGKGGDIVFVADRSVQTLLDFKYKQHYKGNKGGNASSKGKQGRRGESCTLKVPVGTVIRDFDSGLLIRDLSKEQESVVVAKGGLGGVGNQQKRTPKPPLPGEEKTISLELKLVADVGLVGFPNAGKSTIISNISKVKSKIANYPFTTKSPILGIVKDEVDEFSFIVADLPGLIEGAHKGKGLGDRFLRHAERTGILVHVVDMAQIEGRDPVEDYEKIVHELKSYSDSFLLKNKIIVANKMDLPEAADNLKKFKSAVKEEVFEVSAIEKTGLGKLTNHLKTLLCKENSQEKLKE